MKTLPILPTPSHPSFSRILSKRPAPSTQTPTSTALFAVLFLWFLGWYVSLNDIMKNLRMSSLGTLVPEGPSCVFYARCVKFIEIWLVRLFAGADLISHTHTHTHTHTQRQTAYSGANRLTHPYKYMCKHDLLCSYCSYLYYIEWIINWYQTFTFHDVFYFQELLTYGGHISVD